MLPVEICWRSSLKMPASTQCVKMSTACISSNRNTKQIPYALSPLCIQRIVTWRWKWNCGSLHSEECVFSCCFTPHQTHTFTDIRIVFPRRLFECGWLLNKCNHVTANLMTVMCKSSCRVCVCMCCVSPFTSEGKSYSSLCSTSKGQTNKEQCFPVSPLRVAL